ncbi:hypothetical protein B0H12DRAFT_1244841 [Mycena haematopus]|nr:hypothetical protein B0H12DRAFT_1244841 [Mycena haematopus]
MLLAILRWVVTNLFQCMQRLCHIFRPTPHPTWSPPPSRAWIHKDWYTDPTMKYPWSTDWSHWTGLRLFEDTVHDQLMMDRLFKHDWNLAGTIEPLAHGIGTNGDYFLFSAEGRYYFFADGRLTVSRKEFASPKEFLDYALSRPDGSRLPDVEIPMSPGGDIQWLGAKNTFDEVVYLCGSLFIQYLP